MCESEPEMNMGQTLLGPGNSWDHAALFVFQRDQLYFICTACLLMQLGWRPSLVGLLLGSNPFICS